MKRNLFIITIMLFAFSIQGVAQRWKNDPTYSTHNYKHENKSKAVKESGAKKTETLSKKKVFTTASQNYKSQNKTISRAPVLISVVNTSGGSQSVSKNYKQQFTPNSRPKNSIREGQDSIRSAHSFN